MSKPSSARVAFLLLLLLLLLLIVSILAVLAHHISAAGDFEGFDSDELDDADDPPFRPFPPPPTVLAQPSTTPNPPPPPPLPSTPSDHPPLDLYDEDEFEGIPLQSPNPDPKPQPSDPPPPTPPPSPPPASNALEISCLIFLTAFTANYFLGRQQNERMALSFASILAAKNSALDKNFNLLLDGADAPMLLKEGRRVFKFYGAGRRHCRGFSATIELRARHDLIATASDLLFSKRDVITFEVVMNEDAMDQVVLALARREEAKGMQSAERDLRRFASAVATSDSGRKWVVEDLVVMAESKEVAGDLITDVSLDQVFGENIYEKFEKWFISLHFSDQHQGSHKKMLIFKFALPTAKNMADMTRLVALVPYYTDLIGRYKLSPQARSKTEASRAKAAQEAYKELHTARQDALQKRKVERKKWIEEAEAMLSAEVIRKKEATNYSRQPKKSMPRVKMLHSL